MKKRYVVAITLCAIGALALVLGSVGPLTGSTSLSTANHQLHLGQVRDCGEGAGTHACTPEVKAIALSDDGEVIEGRFFANVTAAPELAGESAGQASLTQGYAVWTYPDGSTLVARAEGASKINGAGQLANVGSQSCIFGTGRFADVDCAIDWSHTAQTNGLFPGAYTISITPKAPA